MAALAAVAAICALHKPPSPLDEKAVRHLLAEVFPDKVVQAVWVAQDGSGALAKSGAAALVVCRRGATFVARQMPWGQAYAAGFKRGEIVIDLSDISAPKATVSLRGCLDLAA